MYIICNHYHFIYFDKFKSYLRVITRVHVSITTPLQDEVEKTKKTPHMTRYLDILTSLEH